MKLEEIKNEYVGSDGTKTKIIPLGDIGSEKFALSAKDRLGHGELYVIINDEWDYGYDGLDEGSIYGISERDLALFNAYNYLEDGMEMVGYGENIKYEEEGYDYFCYDKEKGDFNKFIEENSLRFHDKIIHARYDVIYARRKKAEENPELVIELGKQYIRRDGRIYEPVEHNTDVDKISMGYIFKTKDPVHGDYVSYTKNGKFLQGVAISESDLIEEYIKPNTININGYEVPEPVREPLKNGKEYYAASPHTRGKPYLYKWVNCEFDKHALKNGLIHKNKKAVKKHNRALMSFTKLKK